MAAKDLLFYLFKKNFFLAGIVSGLETSRTKKNILVPREAHRNHIAKAATCVRIDLIGHVRKSEP